MPINLGPGKKNEGKQDPANNVVRLPQPKKPLADPDAEEDGEESEEDEDSNVENKGHETPGAAADRAEDEALGQSPEDDPSQSPYIIFPSFPAMVQGVVNKVATHYRYCHAACTQRIRWREDGRLFPLDGDPELGVFPQVVEGDWLVTLFQEQLKPNGRPPYYQKVPWDPRNTSLLVLVRIAAPMRKPLPSGGAAKADGQNIPKTQNGFSAPSAGLVSQSQQGVQAISSNYLAEIIKALPTTQHSAQLGDLLFKAFSQVSARDQMTFNHATEARERANRLEAELEKLKRRQGRGGLIELIYNLFESNPDAFKAFIEQVGPALTMLITRIKLPAKQGDSK